MKLRNFLILSFIGIILLLGFLLSLQNLKLDGATNIKLIETKKLFAGIGEICSTSSFKIDCSKGLTCASKNFKSKFNPKLESGNCINNSLIIN